MRAAFYITALVRNLLPFKGATALLSSLGALYTVLKIGDYFHLVEQAKIQRFWWAFVGAGVLAAIWKCRPKLRVRHKLKDRDVAVEVAIGDLFSFEGAVVIGTNSTFDTEISSRLISERSVQGQFTKRYYGDHTLLDAAVDQALAANGIQPQTLSDDRPGKTKRYPIGTAVRVNSKARIGYLVAITHMNKHGVASDASFAELKQALGDLWVFIGEQGLKGSVAMPVLGSGFARLPQRREVIVQEIIKSFIAACAERTFCDRLTVVLAASDVRKHQVDFEALGEFVRHVCTYTEFAADTDDRVGTPVG